MDWKTWSPFQSENVRLICANMTEHEKSKVEKQGGIYGIWCALTFAVPISFLIMFESLPVHVLAGLLIVLHIAMIPRWQRRQKAYLCSTEWAAANGYKPEDLSLSARKKTR